MDRATARRLLRWEPSTWRQALLSAFAEAVGLFLLWMLLGRVFGPDASLSPGWAALGAVGWVVASLIRYGISRRRALKRAGRRSPTERG